MEREEAGEPSEQLTSSRMGNVSTTESSHMFMSLLAEGSSIRYDSSMQVCGSAPLLGGMDRELLGSLVFSDLMVLSWFSFPFDMPLSCGCSFSNVFVLFS